MARPGLVGSRGRRGLGAGIPIAGREAKPDAGALAGLALHRHPAPMRLHRAEDHGEPQPRALAGPLGRVEGLHGFVQDLPRHPRPVVLDHHLDPVLIDIAGLQREGAIFRHGIHGVHAEVHERERQGAGVAHDGPQIRLEVHLQADLRHGRALQQGRLLPENRIHVEPVVLGGALAGEAQQALDHLAAPLGGLADGVQGQVQRAAHGLGFQVGRSQAEDGRKHIVHVVGDPARQRAQAFHLLGLLKLGLEFAVPLFGRLPFGDVLVDAEHREGMAVPVQQRRLGGLHLQMFAVGLLLRLEDAQLGLAGFQHHPVIGPVGFGFLPCPRQVEVRLPDDLLRILHPGGPGEGFVAAQVPPLRVLPEDGLGNRVQDHEKHRLALPQGRLRFAQGQGRPGLLPYEFRGPDVAHGEPGHQVGELHQEMHQPFDLVMAEPGHPVQGREVGLLVVAEGFGLGFEGLPVDDLVVIEELARVDVPQVPVAHIERGHHVPEAVLALVGDELAPSHVAGQVQVALDAVPAGGPMGTVELRADVLPAHRHQDLSLQVEDGRDRQGDPGVILHQRLQHRGVEQDLQVPLPGRRFAIPGPQGLQTFPVARDRTFEVPRVHFRCPFQKGCVARLLKFRAGGPAPVRGFGRGRKFRPGRKGRTRIRPCSLHG